MSIIDLIFEIDFVKEMVCQMCVLDIYGIYSGWMVEKIFDFYVLIKECKVIILMIGDLDDEMIFCVKVYYNVIVVFIEKECKLFVVLFVYLMYEGFGCVIIIVGKLVVVEKILCDVYCFGFFSLLKMKDDVDKLLGIVFECIGQYLNVVGL